jgi:hypothetical protein
MGTLVTAVAGAFHHQAVAPFYPDMSVAPDRFLGVFFGLGGKAGMYIGARFRQFVLAIAIEWMLAIIIVFISLRYGAAFFGAVVRSDAPFRCCGMKRVNQAGPITSKSPEPLRLFPAIEPS